jgi:hypothetical protein
VGRVWHGSIGDLIFQRADRDRVRIADTSISLQLIRATPGKVDYAVFAHTSNAVLIVPGNTPAVIHERGFIAAGALISHGPNLVDLFGRAAGYGHFRSQQRKF